MDKQHSTQTTKPARRKTKTGSSNLKARSSVAPAKPAPAIVAQSSEQTGRGSLSAKGSAGSGPAAIVATDRLKQSGGYYDWMPVTVGIPEVRSVIVWDYARELPHAAYFDSDDNCWTSLHDGARIEGVTEWMGYTRPDGGDAGSRAPLVAAAAMGQAADQTQDEQLLIAYFREMDDRARCITIACAKRTAEDWPRDFVIPAELEEAQQGVSAHAGESE